MDPKYLIYSQKEIESIVKYYLGTPDIYKYCYNNSPEFKFFVDNANEKLKKNIKQMHTAYHLSHIHEYLMHCATMGISLIIKKLLELKKFSDLKKTIESDEFKTLFQNFDTVLLYNKRRNSDK